jgi:hypothetical protein
MKIIFNDKSYIEVKKSNEPDKVVVLISSRDIKNPRIATINSCEITMEEFERLVSEIKPL